MYTDCLKCFPSDSFTSRWEFVSAWKQIKRYSYLHLKYMAWGDNSNNNSGYSLSSFEEHYAEAYLICNTLKTHMGDERGLSAPAWRWAGYRILWYSKQACRLLCSIRCCLFVGHLQQNTPASLQNATNRFQ